MVAVLLLMVALVTVLNLVQPPVRRLLKWQGFRTLRVSAYDIHQFHPISFLMIRYLIDFLSVIICFTFL
ncbi:hypothetical protein KIN20_025395 [Parelaphostrongylus tenuis]|uniref:Uncharacterized protein n=1 Tax=Parelaphostrongylus tenuis TaxID=148309 RepID=A0AAD5NBU3_PARTN|nr:hypothetical protein KIN20_025395 [Parelaphostrongylus tenuis]